MTALSSSMFSLSMPLLALLVNTPGIGAQRTTNCTHDWNTYCFERGSKRYSEMGRRSAIWWR